VTDRDVLSHAWWLASRSAGIVAYLLLSAAVMVGLAMALRLAPPRARAAVRLGHERIALLALGAIAAHGVLLLGDPWLHPSVTDLAVPFTMSYRPLWTGIGILAADVAAALSLTFYARARIGARRWRRAHRLIPAAWGLAAVHVVGAGTDAGALWLQAVLALTIAACVVLVAARALAPGPAPAPPRRFHRPAPPPPAPEPERLWS
jgi:methionine sulfoxide reductase heme-binding subunit